MFDALKYGLTRLSYIGFDTSERLAEKEALRYARQDRRSTLPILISIPGFGMDPRSVLGMLKILYIGEISKIIDTKLKGR